MIELLKLILGLIAAAVGIIGTVLSILLIIRKKQLDKPNLIFSFKPPEGSPSDIPPRRLKKSLLSFIAFAPQDDYSEPLIELLRFTVVNRGKETLKNVRIMLEYDKHFLVDNKLLESLCRFKPSAKKLEGNSKVAIIKPSLTDQEVEELLDKREVAFGDNRAQVSYEIPIVRPGEGLLLYDMLIFRKGIISGIENLGFGDEGFAHIIKLIRNIKGISNFLVINAWAFSENYEKLNKKLFIVRFAFGVKLDEVLNELGRAFWLGEYPKAGRYFYDIITGIVLRKLKYIGRLSRHFTKQQLGLMVFSKHTEIIDSKAKIYSLPFHDNQEVAYYSIEIPNCDYFCIPSNIDNSKKLIEWLGVTHPFLSKDKKDQK